AQADQAAAAQEAERLAYVAATRARHLLVLGWRDDERHSASPLAPWLLTDGELRCDPSLPLQVLDPQRLPAAGDRWRPPAPEGELQAGPLPRHRLDTGWGRSSYSSWVHGGGSDAPAAREEGRDTGDEGGEVSPGEVKPGTDGGGEEGGRRPEGWERQGPLAGFPRGAGPGEALHRILERLDYGRSALEPGPLGLIGHELERAGLAPELAQPLALGLERLRFTPLGGALASFRLVELAAQEQLNEMNFDLPLAVPNRPGGPRGAAQRQDPPQVRSAALAHCFRAHPQGRFGAGYAARLESLEIASRGFLTGSIDLVFRQGPRWWVLDWKSNWLGERDAAGAPVACGPAHYGEQAMAELMAASHYPLQAHLYLVALHRYLRWRLPGYRPEQNLGGFVYVFLRGMPGPDPRAEALAAEGGTVPGVLVEQPPLDRLLALDALLREGSR
ncbi:MAG: DNA helicase UvrD, partial [Prochlorococcaceae cyanobacterium]